MLLFNFPLSTFVMINDFLIEYQHVIVTTLLLQSLGSGTLRVLSWHTRDRTMEPHSTSGARIRPLGPASKGHPVVEEPKSEMDKL